VPLTFAVFEARAAAAAYEGFWSQQLVQERALTAETAYGLALLVLYNQLGKGGKRWNAESNNAVIDKSPVL
jgi:hypothetical protein